MKYIFLSRTCTYWSRTCTLETGYLQLHTHYPNLYLSRKNSNKTGWKKNKTVCEIRKYLRSSKNARDVWKNPSLQYNASMCPAERELGASPSALVVVTAADLRNIFHFTESGATERRRDRWPRWPWHNTLLHWTADSPISGWKDLISSVCNYFPTYGFLSLFPLCNGGIKHWYMVTSASAKHWQWVDTVQGNNSRNAPLVFFLSYNVLLYVHYQCH